MRVFRILGTLAVVVAAGLMIFTDREKLGVVLLMAGLALVMTDQYRVRAGKSGGS